MRLVIYLHKHQIQALNIFLSHMNKNGYQLDNDISTTIKITNGYFVCIMWQLDKVIEFYVYHVAISFKHGSV